VIGDSLRIYQVICNLLSNAHKFTEQGTISLKLSQRDKSSGLVEFMVTDTGKGIPADKLDAIFEEYRQVSKEATCRCQGVGLGLAISRGLVEKMGGSLGVRSEVGRGSSFFFSLPLKPPSAKP
jgi:signal transduction histidine kinase